VLGGKVAVYDEELVSRFEWMRGAPSDAVATPPMMMVFDLLRLEGQDVRHEPLGIRRDLVERLIDGAPAVLLPVRRLADHGLKAWQEVLEHNYEGLVAKDPESRYVGGRSLWWLGVKQPQYREIEPGGILQAVAGPSKAPRVRSLYRVLRVARHPPEGEGPPSRGRTQMAESRHPVQGAASLQEFAAR
jgi:hypothetical protein